MVVLQDTWLEKGKEKDCVKKLNEAFNWMTKTEERFKEKERAKDGIMTGIRKEIKYEKIIEWKYRLKMSGINVGIQEIINIVAAYSNRKIKEIIEELRRITEEWMGSGGVVLIVGDLNTRIGKQKILKEGKTAESRELEDSTVNSEGIKLSNFYEKMHKKEQGGEGNLVRRRDKEWRHSFGFSYWNRERKVQRHRGTDS